MEYLLVLQWPCSASDDYDLLLSLEEAIREGIEGHGTVDGHDMGSGEMNIFLFTENPKSAFERLKTISFVAIHMSNMKIGYREVGQDEYTPIYPDGLRHFGVI